MKIIPLECVLCFNKFVLHPRQIDQCLPVSHGYSLRQPHDKESVNKRIRRNSV
jgi:hypothetical protein